MLNVKVRAVPLQPHGFYFGGFDILMHRSLEVMRAVGIDAQPLDFWSRDADYDFVHFWGLSGAHQVTVEAAKKYGKKVVVSHLAPPLTLRGWARHAGAWLEGRRRVQMGMLRYVDRLFVHSERQAEASVKMLRMPREKIEVIPAIIDPLLFDHAKLPQFDDLSDYVACIGNIWPRKNQLRLALAARQIGCPMLFAGKIMGGCEAYAAEFASVVKSTPNFRWYPWASEEQLRRIYSNSVGVALASFEETQPMAALEGAAMGKPLLLGNRAYARQKYYAGAYLANPHSISSIAKGLESIRENPDRHTPAHEVLMDCHPDSVGRQFARIFAELS